MHIWAYVLNGHCYQNLTMNVMVTTYSEIEKAFVQNIPFSKNWKFFEELP
jgi:hypothetical protein